MNIPIKFIFKYFIYSIRQTTTYGRAYTGVYLEKALK